MVRLVALVFSALVFAACTREPREITLRLRLAEAIGCQPTVVHRVVLQPLADLPARDRPSRRLDLSGISTIDSFPPETHSVAVLAEGEIESIGGSVTPWTGGGIAVLPGTGPTELVVPLLMLRRACSLSDTMPRAPPGSAVTALPDGRLLVVGGERGERSPLLLVTLGLGERLATTVEVVDSRPRVGLSATPLGGDLVLLAGGGGSATSNARESYEVVRVGDGTIVSDGILRGPRRDHGAARLPDGRVLLVGGTDEGGDARRDAELIEVNADGSVASATLTEGPPDGHRIGGEVLVLDDGTVLLLGGVDAAGLPIARIERFDPLSATFETLATSSWPARGDADYVPLAGGRVARVGGREEGLWSTEVDVLLERGDTHVPLGPLLAGAFESPRGVGLPDGRLLVVGREGAVTRVQIIDPGGSRDELEALLPAIEASRAATHLVLLADGTIAELDEVGLSLLRVDLASVFVDPAATINPVQVNQRAELSFDAVGRWEGMGDLLVAVVPGARFDLPSSRFASVAIELEAEGALDLLLTVDAAAPITITIDDMSARSGACEVPIDGPLRVERVGARLSLASGGASAECDLPEGLGRVGVAVRAAMGSGVRRIAVTRL